MQVDPSQHDEYKKRHSPIWAELETALKEGGANNYSIFLDPETSQLFGYIEIEDEKRWKSVASTEICQRWWKHMSDIMPSNPDNSPITKELKEVFHLD